MSTFFREYKGILNKLTFSIVMKNFVGVYEFGLLLQEMESG